MIEIKHEELSEKNIPDRLKLRELEERGLCQYCFDAPQVFKRIIPYFDGETFTDPIAGAVMKAIKAVWAIKPSQVPTREAVKDYFGESISMGGKEELEIWKKIEELIFSELNPRNEPYLREQFVAMAQYRALQPLYTERGLDNYSQGNLNYIHETVEKAFKISLISAPTPLISEVIKSALLRDKSVTFQSGFGKLDQMLDCGGVIAGEVFCYMGPTNSGKSILLQHTARINARNKKVLYLSLEMGIEKVSERIYAAESNIAKAELKNNIETMEKRCTLIKDNLRLVKLPSIKTTTDELFALAVQTRDMFGLDVLVLDYLDLLGTNHSSRQANTYERQKVIAHELFALAGELKIPIFTATQSNRQGENAETIDLSQIADSYGKAMPLDFIVSINNNINPSIERVTKKLILVKNRDGAKGIPIDIEINFLTMRCTQLT